MHYWCLIIRWLLWGWWWWCFSTSNPNSRFYFWFVVHRRRWRRTYFGWLLNLIRIICGGCNWRFWADHSFGAGCRGRVAQRLQQPILPADHDSEISSLLLSRSDSTYFIFSRDCFRFSLSISNTDRSLDWSTVWSDVSLRLSRCGVCALNIDSWLLRAILRWRAEPRMLRRLFCTFISSSLLLSSLSARLTLFVRMNK